MNCFGGYIITLVLLFRFVLVMPAQGVQGAIPGLVDIHADLSASPVNCIYKDSRGYLWFCTFAGIHRYDGYRFRSFFYQSGDENTLPDNHVTRVQEDGDGNLWLRTAVGISVYHRRTGTFGPLPIRWMQALGIRGTPDKFFIDSTKNIWFAVKGRGVYFYARGSRAAYLFPTGTGKLGALPKGKVTDFSEFRKDVLVVFSNGYIARLDGKSRRVLWVNDYLAKRESQPYDYNLDVDSHGNCWVLYDGHSAVWDSRHHRWFNSAGMMLRAHGYQVPAELTIHDFYIDHRHRLWLAAEQTGVIQIDTHAKNVMTFPCSKDNFGAIPSADINCIYVDDLGALWVGSSHHGVIYCSAAVEHSVRFGPVSLFTRGNKSISNLHASPKIPFSLSPPIALFTGLLIYDHPVRVGEKYDGRVVLPETLTNGSTLTLNSSDKAFTIQLASSVITVPSQSRFLYRLKGFNDKWLCTSEEQPAVTFTNLSAGRYTLEVKVVQPGGIVSSRVSRLFVHMEPPFYQSTWAMIAYLCGLCGLVYFIRRRVLENEQRQLAIAQREMLRLHRLHETRLTVLTHVSHELSTPLSLVISPLSNLMAAETDEERLRKLELVHRNALRMQNLVNRMTVFCNMQNEVRPPLFSTGNFVNFVRIVCNAFVAPEGITPTISFHSDKVSVVMLFDEERMRDALNTLLLHVCGCSEGQSRLTVEVRMLTSDDVEVRIYATDRESAPKEAQADSVDLNWAEETIEMHGGTVCLMQPAGKGIVFVLPARRQVMVPLAEQSDCDSLQHHGIVTLPAKEKLHRYELLLIDECVDFREFLANVLEPYYDVREAAGATDALREIELKAPDLIVSDVTLSDMDGNELCRRLKTNKTTARIPFIMLTARQSSESKIEGMENGADDYITKPCNVHLLHLRIENLLRLYNENTDGRKIELRVQRVEVTSLDEKLVHDATKFVEDNIGNSDLSVEMMGVSLNMSRMSLYKRLLAVTGNTPSEFIRIIRMQRAEQLLLESQLSVGEIAYMVGFNTPRYFSRYFTEMYGMTPSQYKRNKPAEPDI